VYLKKGKKRTRWVSSRKREYQERRKRIRIKIYISWDLIQGESLGKKMERFWIKNSKGKRKSPMKGIFSAEKGKGDPTYYEGSHEGKHSRVEVKGI